MRVRPVTAGFILGDDLLLDDAFQQPEAIAMPLEEGGQLIVLIEPREFVQPVGEGFTAWIWHGGGVGP